MSSHLKRCFLRSDFLLKYSQNPPVLKRWSTYKKGKEKLQASLQIKGEANILREKTLQLQKSFLM
jgi:hypothetical protein